MDADLDSDAPQPEISAHVASCVIRVGELDRSLKSYCDVFWCNVVVRETDMALLAAPNGSHIYVHAPSLRRRAASTRRGPVLAVGHRNTESDLQELRSGCAPTTPGSSPTPKTE